MGCASSEFARDPQVNFAVTPSPATLLRAGEPTVVDEGVSPLVAIDAVADDGQLAVSFVQRGTSVLAHVNPSTGEVTSRQTTMATRSMSGRRRVPQGVTLASGRVVVCWAEGSVEDGYRAFAQVFDPQGSARGEPVAISPADADVFGVPHPATVDGRHVVATFVASVDGVFKLLSVSLEGT